ncbi:S-adenosyl-L-methionine-dependent methyltransferase [Trametes meyenii]|nr:S-adenosyl-L-methionine-dependent methyltransferase [Trametes meyenii]
MSQVTTTAQGATHDFVEANKKYFDEHADKFEEEHPKARELALMTVAKMRERYPALFDGARTSVMDFACGTGLISQALRPHVKSVVGVDISQVSVDIYNKAAADLGFASQLKAVRADLKGEPGELDGAKFDLVTCCAAFHHIEAIDAITRTLASFLKPGGALLVTDIRAAPDGAELFPPTHHHMVPHRRGLSEAAMRAAFAGAGLVGVELRDAYTLGIIPGAPETVWFLVRGVKPQAAA